MMEAAFVIVFVITCIITIIVICKAEKFSVPIESPYSYGTVVITDYKPELRAKKTVFGDASSITDPKILLPLDTPTRCGYTKFETDNTQGSGATKLNADDIYFSRWIHGEATGDEPGDYVCGVKPKFICGPPPEEED